MKWPENKTKIRQRADHFLNDSPTHDKIILVYSIFLVFFGVKRELGLHIEILLNLEILQELNRLLSNKVSKGIQGVAELLSILHENHAFQYGFLYGCQTYRLSDSVHGPRENNSVELLELEEEIEKIKRKNGDLPGPISEFLDEEQGRLNFAEREYIGKKETFVERTQKEGLLGLAGEGRVYDRKAEQFVPKVEYDLSKVKKGFVKNLKNFLPK